jgi:hypothetical protein
VRCRDLARVGQLIANRGLWLDGNSQVKCCCKYDKSMFHFFSFSSTTSSAATGASPCMLRRLHLVDLQLCAFQAYQMIHPNYIEELLTPQFPGTPGEDFMSDQYDHSRPQHHTRLPPCHARSRTILTLRCALLNRAGKYCLLSCLGTRCYPMW